MWRGQVRSTVRWVTERVSSEGMLNPFHVVQDERTVLDLLREKHPPISQCSENACIFCKDLPPLVAWILPEFMLRKS